MEVLIMPLWITLVLIGMPCITLLTVVLVWWRIELLNNESRDHSDKLFADQVARTQVIMASLETLLRRGN